MNINFTHKLFNPNFYWANSVLNDSKIRYAFFYGGTSSGKTYSLVQAHLLRTLEDGRNTIVFRKVSSSIDNSIYKDFKDIINNLQLTKYFTLTKHKIKCCNGAEIDFLGLDNPEKVKGISSYLRIIVDEITELELPDFKQLRKRMRGIKNQTLCATFNPISEEHWLKQEVFDKLLLKKKDNKINNNIYSKVNSVHQAGNYIFIKTTYKDNYWVVGSPCKQFGYVDQHTIDDFKTDKKVDINFYNINALGEWGAVSTGSEFYKNFDRTKHVGSFDIDPDLPIHVSFDENVRPYFPITVSQIEDGYIKVCDEILGYSPYNDVNSVFKMFIKEYKSFINSKIFLYGDSTSRKIDARTEKGYNLFGIILDLFDREGFKNVKNAAPISNPSVSMSGIFMNRVLAGVQSHELLINEDCMQTIADFSYLKEDKDGGILKERVRDKETGLTWEKYGHLSDSIRYMVLVYLKEEYDKLNNKSSSSSAFEITIDEAGLAY
jgi:phage terminase large subunit